MWITLKHTPCNTIAKVEICNLNGVHEQPFVILIQTSISCLQVFIVVYPSMLNNSETLKNLNGIKPDFFSRFQGHPLGHLWIFSFRKWPTASSLHQAGNEKYEDFINGISTSLSRQWARNMSSEDVSKDDRYVLRLATVLHVPYDQLPWLLTFNFTRWLSHS